MRIWKLKNGDTFKDCGREAFLSRLRGIAFRDRIDNVIEEHIAVSLALGHIQKHEVRKTRDLLRKQLLETGGKFLINSLSDKKELWEKLRGLYQSAAGGDIDAAISLWCWLEDYERLLLTLHFWSGVKENWMTPEVWGTVLCNTWQRGKTGTLLLKAKISAREVTEMFRSANPKSLMAGDNEFEAYNNLPDKIEIWRGTSSQAEHQSTGMSWTLDPIQAEWFALFRCGSGTPILCRTVVEKKHILAAFDYEKEVVLNPIELAKTPSVDTKVIHNTDARAQQIKAILENRKEIPSSSTTCDTMACA